MISFILFCLYQILYDEDEAWFCFTNSPYYKELYNNISDEFELSELPPTNKKALMSHSMLGGYPTVLELLIAEQKSGHLRINPVIIMTGGEYLSDDLRKKLSEAFQCYVQTNNQGTSMQ